MAPIGLKKSLLSVNDILLSNSNTEGKQDQNVTLNALLFLVQLEYCGKKREKEERK